MRKFSIYISLMFAAASLFSGCSDDVPTVGLGIDDVYYVARMQKLFLRPALTGKEYRWSVDGNPVADTREYIFLAREEGSHTLRFEIIDDETPYEYECRVNVLHEEVEYSPYISKVLEYCPAPGQFVNDMPKYEEGDTYADILRKAEESISGTNDVLISLGGFGGYVTFSFDHTVVNVPGEADFRIWGNAFYELTDPTRKGGSAEPGIVEVSFDTNGNGLPDDEWYEIRGSEYDNPDTRHNLTIRYARPEREPVSSSDDYIRWTDSDGRSGTIPKNVFHQQSYYPLWTDAPELVFTGTCLPPNGVDTSGRGDYFVLYCFGYGYADNHPNDETEMNSFDISTAVDSSGRKVMLPGADFIRVRTGENQVCGWLGETSTEICRAQDLHLSPLNPFQSKFNSNQNTHTYNLSK